ncbi:MULTISPECIES: FAD-dependent oxidoreductase [Ramlibacter]|uniref:FAD-dependent oxidoreductase n=1 Tax=Ramlibacter pinisoli TaxID=2682844 RepID=A0A6N8J094_9BURK|nr:MULTISPECIES: FAD-dependent oxidoreductase [Ramlibacter]MBA2961663.1 FAD-dependent oxidoreductase [Ramlibacter sp. CGMCC 1.13660]MVQ31606.1 FAD-dependent oxidoreductase [Ramlibacter pinisoli]
MGTQLTADVLVCGGGVAGTMAAVAAARQGADVILAERYGFLGGNATAGAVAQFNSWQTANGRRVVAGLAAEVVERLRTYGGAGEHHQFVMSTGHKMDRVEYAPEVLKLVLDDMVGEAGVRPLLHASLLDVRSEARQVRQVRLLTKSGVLAVEPRFLIDCSGDLDALKQAGAAFLELDEGEALQPATMMFRFGPVDFARFDALSAEETKALAARGFAQGALARAALHAARDPFSDDAWFNISRLGIDATDAMALGRAEIEGRRQAWRAATYLREAVPGCGEGRLRAFGTQVGVRETRRVAGDHVLSAEELLHPVEFADAIAAGAYPIDIHPASGGELLYSGLGDDHAYQIPYRSLIPAALGNALVAGRGISATHQALAAIRVMTISMAVGQAAGTAAGLACREGARDVRQVSVPRLRTALQDAGACLR